MHADPAEIKKSVRRYVTIGGLLFLFTAITVAANQVHFAIPVAIAVAIIIAGIKGSMVGAVFMHLSNEKKWIYGALLLTAVFFMVLMLVPFLTTADTYGTRIAAPGAATDSETAPAEHEH